MVDKDALMDMQAEDLMEALNQLSHLQRVRETMARDNSRLQAALSASNTALQKHCTHLEGLEELRRDETARWGVLLCAAQATAVAQNAHHSNLYSELLCSFQALSASLASSGGTAEGDSGNDTGGFEHKPGVKRQASKGSRRVRRPLGRANTVCTSKPRPKTNYRGTGVKTCYL